MQYGVGRPKHAKVGQGAVTLLNPSVRGVWAAGGFCFLVGPIKGGDLHGLAWFGKGVRRPNNFR